MLGKKSTFILLISFALLAACGGGGGGGSASSSGQDGGEKDPFSLVLAETRNEGLGINLFFGGGFISETLPEPAAFSVTADGVVIPVSAVKANGTTVDLVLTRRIQSGQIVAVSYNAPAYDPLPGNAAIQNRDGVDAAGFSGATVRNTVAAWSVLINGATASLDSSGEYLVSSPARVTVEDSRVGSSSTESGGAISQIHTISGNKYDVTFSNGPVGGLTTIKLGGSLDAPILVIKLRWQ